MKKLEEFTIKEFTEYALNHKQNHKYVVFYPETCNAVRRNLELRNESIWSRISLDRSTIKSLEHAFLAYQKGLSKFEIFRRDAYEYTYNSTDFDRLAKLRIELADKGVLRQLNKEERIEYPLVFSPINDLSQILQKGEYLDILNELDLVNIKHYRVYYDGINKTKLLYENNSTNSVLKPAVFELGNLTLYPDGRLLEGSKKILSLDTKQGTPYELIKLLFESQHTINEERLSKGEITTRLRINGNGNEVLKNTQDYINKRLRKKGSNYRIRSNSKNIWFGTKQR